MGAGDDAPLHAVSPSDLVGTWTVEEIFDSPEQPYVAFAEDNTWRASDGCNQVHGTWELATDGSLTTTSGPHTMMACDGVAIPAAVATAASVTITAGALVLHGAEGGFTTELVRAAAEFPVGPLPLPGTWSADGSPAAPFLVVEDDGTYSGNDGCNGFAGRWTTTEDGAIQLSAGPMTLMACPGVDTWLSTATLGRVISNVMTLQASDGLVLGQLTKS